MGLQADTEALLEKVESERAAGYQRIKIKIKPGKRGDCVRIKAGNAKVGKGKIKNGKCKS